MSTVYIIKKLLVHGALTMREIVEITGIEKRKVIRALSYMVEFSIIKHDGFWGGVYANL